jgi:hypothetical protein
MIVLRLLAVFIFTGLLTGCDPDVKTIKDDIASLKIDTKALRGLLSTLPTPVQCPAPGAHTTMICHYTLQIEGPHGDHKGWFVATIPKEVVEKAKTDCENMKIKKPDMANHLCVDPKTYAYRKYAIQVDGTVPDKASNEFVNDPVTDHLMIFKK